MDKWKRRAAVPVALFAVLVAGLALKAHKAPVPSQIAWVLSCFFVGYFASAYARRDL